MSLTPHIDDSRSEGQDMTAMQNPAAKTPAAALDKPTRGRPPTQGGATGLRGQCWWLMRELNTFTINRLLETYADGTEKDAHNNLMRYLHRLESCGVVERLERRQPGDSLTSPGFVVWRLKRNLGVLAPVWRRLKKVLWDPNAGQIVPFKTTQAEQQDSSVHSEPDSND